ncbi:hypothetical protein [Nocardia sp. NPDC047038]|uniref:hypothetical protein n=1 Tax=Nocardia sp. NPDC047038 TaxID=3154338 RepID=UPI0033F0D144
MPSINSASAQREVEIQLGECVTADQRPFVEQSIAAMIERHSERMTRQRTENREHAELMRAIHAPLLEIIEQDQDASAALSVLRAKGQLDSGGDGVGRLPVRDSSRPGLLELRGLEIIGVPYHYDWNWHDGDGELRPNMKADRIAGTAKVASHVIGSGTWVTGHAGIGVAMTTDQPIAAAAARPARTTWDRYRASGAPIGGIAISELGTEVTVFEDGKLIASGTDKRWRARASNGELKQHNTDGFGINDLIEVKWIMQPDHIYTLNVGAWTYCEYHDGVVGQSQAHAEVDARFLFIGLDRS